MKNYLLELPPTSLFIDGVEYPIQTDFRTVLRYDRIIREERADGTELDDALKLMYGGIPVNVVDAMMQLNWFIRGGEEEKKSGPSRQILGINNEKPMDYAVDSRLIWSAFMRIYGIDLRKIEYLHWWEFLDMLEELPEDVRLNKIIRYRTIDTKNKNLSKDERSLYTALQKYYRIREKPSEREEQLMEALRNGEDPTPYL